MSMMTTVTAMETSAYDDGNKHDVDNQRWKQVATDALQRPVATLLDIPFWFTRRPPASD